MSNNNLNNQISEKLLCIKGEPFKYVGRAGNLAWLGFGKNVISKNYKGEKRKIARYALHIQCPFRVSCKGEKRIGSGDMYEPNSATEWTEDFVWDELGANLYDENALLLMKELSYDNVTVTKINSNEMGDLQIYLSNHWIVEVFTNGSSNSEEWRFFETGIKNEHFVITGKGIER